MKRIGRRTWALTPIGHTPSQYWAKTNTACVSGRRRLGPLSVYEYWQRTMNIGDLQWIALRLKPTDLTLDADYRGQVHRAGKWAKGAWRYPSRMRKALIAIMSAYDVRWPAEIL